MKNSLSENHERPTMLNKLFVFVSVIYLTSAAVYIKAPCPEVKSVENFNFAAFATGQWFEIARYPNDIEKRGKCVTITTNDHYDKDNFKFKVTEVLDGKSNSFEGYYGLAPEAGSTGILNIHSANFTETETKGLLPIHVIAIDYDSYGLLYQCNYNEMTKTRHDYAWIQSRSNKLDGKAKEELDNYLKSSNIIDSSKLIWLDFTEESCKTDG